MENISIFPVPLGKPSKKKLMTLRAYFLSHFLPIIPLLQDAHREGWGLHAHDLQQVWLRPPLVLGLSDRVDQGLHGEPLVWMKRPLIIIYSGKDSFCTIHNRILLNSF